jgi:hypothetical protein
VPSGLIHDWIGAAFIPNATMAEALAVLRDYRRYREIYRPAVIDSKAFDVNESEDRFSVVLMNRSVISKTALDTNYRAVYTKLDDHRWYSVAETAGIQEIADYGTAAQHALPKDQGTGLIWRMVNIARFEERDGGVYVEIEAIALPRCAGHVAMDGGPDHSPSFARVAHHVHAADARCGPAPYCQHDHLDVARHLGERVWPGRRSLFPLRRASPKRTSAIP